MLEHSERQLYYLLLSYLHAFCEEFMDSDSANRDVIMKPFASKHNDKYFFSKFRILDLPWVRDSKP